MSDERLRYPIGRMPALEGRATAEQREEWIRSIESLPVRPGAAVSDLTLEELLAQYAWHSDHHLAHITKL